MAFEMEKKFVQGRNGDDFDVRDEFGLGVIVDWKENGFKTELLGGFDEVDDATDWADGAFEGELAEEDGIGWNVLLLELM